MLWWTGVHDHPSRWLFALQVLNGALLSLAVVRTFPFFRRRWLDYTRYYETGTRHGH